MVNQSLCRRLRLVAGGWRCCFCAMAARGINAGHGQHVQSRKMQESVWSNAWHVEAHRGERFARLIHMRKSA